MNMQASAVTGSPVVEALATAAGSVAAAQAAPAAALVDADLEAVIEQAQAVAARVFDLTLGLVREADERDLGRRSGAASTAAWLAGRYRIRPGQARALVRLANQTRADDGPIDWSANVRAGRPGVSCARPAGRWPTGPSPPST